MSSSDGVSLELNVFDPFFRGAQNCTLVLQIRSLKRRGRQDLGKNMHFILNLFTTEWAALKLFSSRAFLTQAQVSAGQQQY